MSDLELYHLALRAVASAPSAHEPAPSAVDERPRRTRAERNRVLHVMRIVWEVHYKPYVVSPSVNALFKVMLRANRWETDLHDRVRLDYWSGVYDRRCAAAGRYDLYPTEEELEGWIV